MEAESPEWQASAWRSVPSWVFEGLIRGFPFALICAWVGSIGGFAIAVCLQIALAGAEQRVRRASLLARWASMPLVFAPLVAFGTIGFVAQVGYTAVSSSVPYEGFQVALESVRHFEDWGSWSALALIAGAMLCISGTRIRLVPQLSPGVIGGAFVVLSILLAAWNPDLLGFMILPVGVAIGSAADFVEAVVERAIRGLEGRRDSLDRIYGELLIAIKAGCPPWTNLDDYLAELEGRLAEVEEDLRALRAELAAESVDEPLDSGQT